MYDKKEVVPMEKTIKRIPIARCPVPDCGRTLMYSGEAYELFENKCDGVIKVAVEC